MNEPLFHLFDAAPAPVAPYSHAVEAEGWVFLTGQIANHPHRDAIPSGIEAQTRRTMDNLIIVLGELGLDLAHVVAARVFLTHFEEDYETMNAVYRGYFPEGRLPARTCIGVSALARGSRVEIDFIARRFAR